jgi:lysophospholipase L1-like esterase
MMSGLRELLCLAVTVLCLPQMTSAAEKDDPSSKEAAKPVEVQARQGLANFFERARQGQELRVAYLGGSITSQPGWRPKSLAWLQQKFPKARLSEINAAIGGTGSDLGVFRLKHDVLDRRPDLLFVEFAVNDSGAAPEQIQRTMEGIVRQTWRQDPGTDICFVYTIAGNMLPTLKEGQLPRSEQTMERVAEHYGIPSINFGVEVARMERDGKLIFKGDKPKTDAERAALADKVLFSPDGVHPYVDSGHDVYLQAFARGMEAMQDLGPVKPRTLTAPLVEDNWEAAQMLPLNRAKLSAGWQRLDPQTSDLAKRFAERMPELWKANQPGSTMEFKFRGRVAAVYDLLAPDSGQVIVTLDDKPARIVPRFDAYTTGARIGMLMIGTGLPDEVHRVKLEIHRDQPDKATILSQRQQTIDKPERYNDTAWYASRLMIVGELVE